MLRNRPGQRLAYLPNSDPQPLAECMVAFANAQGGTIVLGVGDNGRLADNIWEEEAEGAIKEAAALCSPPVPSQWQEIESRIGSLISINISSSSELHSMADGRVLVRSGMENRPLTGEEIRKLALAKNTAEFETELVAGGRFDDLNQEIILEYFANREKRGAAKVSDTTEALFEIGATDREGNPTAVGILLFGKNPQAFFPQSGLVFVRFPGTEPRGEEGIGYGRRDELTGPLPRIVERAWNIIYEEMRVGATVDKLERQELTEYPRFAVRESLVNAIAHRDYRIRGRRIEIRMYADRMEIISPGGLAGHITVDNIVEEHFSRNPRLVQGLYQWGYIEELGLGIDQMIEDMVQAGHEPPQFRAKDHSFTVLLSNKRERTVMPKWTGSMNERQTRALAYVRENGSITNREYRNICTDVSPETLRLDLKDLVERGLLLKIGSKRGTTYILK